MECHCSVQLHEVKKNLIMLYPLLFPYGEDGYKEDVPYMLKKGAKCKRKHLIEYYAYRP